MSSGRQLASCCFRPAPLAALHRLWLATTRVTRRARCNTYCACCRTCSGVCSAGTVELAKIAGASLFRTGGVSLFRTKLVLGRREPPRRRRSLARRSPIQHSLHTNPRAQELGRKSRRSFPVRRPLAALLTGLPVSHLGGPAAHSARPTHSLHLFANEKLTKTRTRISTRAGHEGRRRFAQAVPGPVP